MDLAVVPIPSRKIPPDGAGLTCMRSDISRFYFDVRVGSEAIPDPEGFELDGLEAAEHEATQTVLTLGRDWLPRAREVRVELGDEQYQLQLTLRASRTVERSG